MIAKPGGLYIHIPFCRKKCSYCDFYSESHHLSFIPQYVHQLQSEIAFWQKHYADRLCFFDTIYFGGGSPSLLSLAQIENLILSLTKHNFVSSSIKEFTIELNPEQITKEYCQGLKQLGVTKISLGLQALTQKSYQELGRLGSIQENLQAIEWAMDCGVDIVSADLMFALPHQTIEDLDYSIIQLLKRGVKHLSFYQLTVANNHFLIYKQPKEKMQAKMFYRIHDFLKKIGWKHYEISNFAQSEHYFSQHNMHYWLGDDYLGLGAGAHSRLQDIRINQPISIADYLQIDFSQKTNTLTSNWERVGWREIFLEFLIGRLRITNKICLEEIPLPPLGSFNSMIQQNFFSLQFQKKMTELRQAGFLDLIEDGWQVNQRGMLFYDSMLESFLSILD